MTYLPSDTRYDTMLYRRCGRSGLMLPAISLGLWHNFGGVDTFENARAMVLCAFDLGITHFDLANNYGPPPGSAEENFGRILKQDLARYRDELVISTKAGYWMWPGPYGEWGSRKYLIASLDQSLKRMGLEYVDIFYSHRPDPETPLEETMAALDHVVRQGKALYAGISSYTPDQTREAVRILREKGYSDAIVDTILSHGNTGVARDTLMAKTLHAVDELTGLLVAVALVRPSKDIRDVKIKSVRKKWKDKAFAAAVNREEIAHAATTLDIDLWEHVGVVLEAMKGVASEIGLDGQLATPN